MTGLEDRIKRKRGRPREADSFNRRIRFCCSEEHEYMKRALEEELCKNGSEVLREALEEFYKFKLLD